MEKKTHAIDIDISNEVLQENKKIKYINKKSFLSKWLTPEKMRYVTLFILHNTIVINRHSAVALQLRAPPPKVSARAPAHRSYHFRGVKLKSCIKKIHHNLYISKQANVRIKHADTEGSSHKKFGTDARVQ